MTLSAYLLLAAVLFAIGLYGVLTRRDLVALVISIELMANAANINLVAYAHFSDNPRSQALALFAIALTVAEVAIGLALLILASRTAKSTDTDAIAELHG